MHEKRVLHRDIKTDNVMLCSNGMIKLGDFGLSTSLAQSKIKTVSEAGTPYYTSPEQFSSKPYGFEADVWSLGILLYRLCALKYPFDPKPTVNEMALLSMARCVLAGKYDDLPAHFSKELQLLVECMLQHKPTERPSINDILRYDIVK